MDLSQIWRAVEVRYPGRRLPKLFSSQNEAKFSGDASLYTGRVNQGFSGVLDCFVFFCRTSILTQCSFFPPGCK